MLTRAIVLARRGATGPAREALEAAGFDESISDEQNRAMLWWARAEVLAGESRHSEAAAAAHHGSAAAATLWIGHPAVKASIMIESWCALRAGDRATGAEMLERLEQEPLGGLSPRLVAHRALLRAMLADESGAAELYAAAIPLARSAGSPWHLAIALAEQAAAGVESDEALAEVREILGRLDATAALDRIAPPASQARTAAAK